MHYRILSRDEISKLNEFDRTETIEHIYYMRQGNLVLEAEHWDVPDWSDAAKQERIVYLQTVYDKGATFFGAFDAGKLVGMVVLDHNLVQTGDKRLNLEGLWVSDGYRGKGVGKTLFNLAAQTAKMHGAKIMYVSATPSENTVHFYQRLGCQHAQPIDPTLFEKEPDDIHLELSL
ncbi:MAG: GNAT family N-acetyltransferase [Chloroflexi bacterium]|nr:GNAT family N-acetyltransferase [Chloroflexota bacterium]